MSKNFSTQGLTKNLGLQRCFRFLKLESALRVSSSRMSSAPMMEKEKVVNDSQVLNDR